MRLIAVFPALLAIITFAAPVATAQGLFAPAIRVNDRVITNYEIQQRVRLLGVLNNPGNPAEVAREGLIDDRLRLDAAEAAGIRLAEEQIRAGMEEFAGRANLSLDQFLGQLGGQGIEPETLRDFVRAGLSWRELIRARFAPRTQVTQSEIDMALATSSSGDAVRVLLAEIIIPAPPQRRAEAMRIAEQLGGMQSFTTFSQRAREVSATPTRDQGGRLPWLPLSRFPPQLRTIFLGLEPGEVTEPLPLDNAVAVFQLRAIEEVTGVDREYASIDYAALYLPGGRSAETLAEAARITAATDTCDDLYGIAKDLPPEQLERSDRAPGDIPQDIAVELAKLDPGETSTLLTRADGDTLMLLMLCGRTAAGNTGTDREQVETQLRNAKLNSVAESFLAQLRADAVIRDE
ncbi:periplasmic chaperone for outer membrane proteins SurA [Poseidonocella pacifica]|uniref:Parvulin-like PPIase n=1 Tax=Poseidonocella pacifica TaxID=871651 RepID=A0A1I0VAB2_9RHOB|nr:peptidylprolyl isomerase [Poseidonocella pacifica]SFA73291.1 periplasmic chaperone for outer membrane proteins SurA [Poseidonocella pacifica]